MRYLQNGVVKDEDSLRADFLLQQLLYLSIIHTRDPTLARKVLFDTLVLHVLEARRVEAYSVLFLLATDVMDNSRLRILSDVTLALALRDLVGVLERWLVVERSEVVKGSLNVARGEDCNSGHVELFCCLGGVAENIFDPR